MPEMLSECLDLSTRLTRAGSSITPTGWSTSSSSYKWNNCDLCRDNCFGVDYQPPTPAPAREHIIGEDEEEAGGNPTSKDPSSNHSNSNSSLHSNRPHPAQHTVVRPSGNPSRPTPPKPVAHPPRPVGGGHPSKVPPPPLSTWGAPPASMAPPSGPMARGGGAGGNLGQPSSKAHSSKPPGRSNKANLPPLDVSLERKKSINSSLDVSTCLDLGICLLEWIKSNHNWHINNDDTCNDRVCQKWEHIYEKGGRGAGKSPLVFPIYCWVFFWLTKVEVTVDRLL